MYVSSLSVECFLCLLEQGPCCSTAGAGGISLLGKIHYIQEVCTFLKPQERKADFFLKKLFLQRGEGKDKEREGGKYQCVVASHMAPTGDLARNPGTCPDWESNQ